MMQNPALKPWAYIPSQGVLGGLINGEGGLYPDVSERRDKTCLRNELKLTYHYILSYIYNTFIVRHNKRRIYFKNIYKTNLCDWLKRNAKGTHFYSIWAYKRGGGLYPE